MFMNNEQVGIYIRLLCSQHQHGGLIDKGSFNSLVQENPLLKSKFIETETGFYNVRLTEEMEKRNKKSNNMSEIAKQVWAKRNEEKNKIDTIVLQKQYKSNTKVKKNDTFVIQPVNEDENEIEDVNRNEIEKVNESNIYPSFSDFWNLYDKKINREKVEKKWDKLSQEIKEKIINYLPEYIKSKPEKQYRLNPETFLNNKSWENEIIFPAVFIKPSKIDDTVGERVDKAIMDKILKNMNNE